MFADVPSTQTSHPAPQTGLQDRKLLDRCPPSMERNLEGIVDDCHFDAKGCCNAMELDT